MSFPRLGAGKMGVNRRQGKCQRGLPKSSGRALRDADTKPASPWPRCARSAWERGNAPLMSGLTTAPGPRRPGRACPCLQRKAIDRPTALPPRETFLGVPVARGRCKNLAARANSFTRSRSILFLTFHKKVLKYGLTGDLAHAILGHPRYTESPPRYTGGTPWQGKRS